MRRTIWSGARSPQMQRRAEAFCENYLDRVGVGGKTLSTGWNTRTPEKAVAQSTSYERKIAI
jgi:hypothetical protein